MAVELYRRGTKHVRNGIQCEAQIFNEYSFVPLLDAGWFLTPEEAYATAQTEEPETEEESRYSRGDRCLGCSC